MSAKQETDRGGLNQVPGRLQFTPEEVAVLRRCRFDSTVYRGLPAGIASAYVVRTLCRSGVFGNLGKRFPAVLWSSALGIGFYAGVASYQQACFDQIMKLENSTLAEQLRARERIKRGDVPLDSSPSLLQSSKSERHVHTPSEMEMLTPQADAYDPPPDTYQNYSTQTDLLSEKESESIKAKRSTSFDEIRAQHRRQRGEQYSRIPPQDVQSPSSSHVQNNSRRDHQNDRIPITSNNKYGDVGWE